MPKLTIGLHFVPDSSGQTLEVMEVRQGYGRPGDALHEVSRYIVYLNHLHSPEKVAVVIRDSVQRSDGAPLTELIPTGTCFESPIMDHSGIFRKIAQSTGEGKTSAIQKLQARKDIPQDIKQKLIDALSGKEPGKEAKRQTTKRTSTIDAPVVVSGVLVAQRRRRR